MMKSQEQPWYLYKWRSQSTPLSPSALHPERPPVSVWTPKRFVHLLPHPHHTQRTEPWGHPSGRRSSHKHTIWPLVDKTRKEVPVPLEGNSRVSDP